MKTLIFTLCATLLLACSEAPTQEVAEKDPSRINVKPTATSIVNTEKTVPVEVPVYNFAELEPIFRKKNDSTYVINFWATWCAPCVKELPYFEELNETYAEQKVKVILVSLDFERQIKKKLIPFLEKHELESEVVVLVDPDANTWINKISPDWSGAIPATVVYNASNWNFYEQSFESFEELNAIVKPLINK